MRLLLLAATLALAAGCAQSHSNNGPSVADRAPRLPQRLASQHLPNAWQVHERVISGGQPEGDAAFAELAALGIKTVISVDGARPDVAAARKHGLRYVHLPHGYDGIAPERARELAKAVRDLPGPVYLHCHHGKHRSPSAAAVACVGAGLIPPFAAEPVLQSAGTSKNYEGLYRSAREARQIEARLLDEMLADFPEVARLPPVAEAMVAIEQTFDRLKAIEASGWRSPANHPDLSPPHEALLLREHFTELLRSEATEREPAEYRDLLRESLALAETLEAALGDSASTAAQKGASAALARVADNCQRCHSRFRDVPLGEKVSR